MLRRFWQNLGLTYKDIEKLPLYTTEMLTEMMNLEEQFQDRNIGKQTNNNYGQNNPNRIKRKR